MNSSTALQPSHRRIGHQSRRTYPVDLVVYRQYYRTRSPERKLEIDECLRRNLNHPGISRMVLYTETDAPPVPQGTVPVEVVNSDERITYAEWFRWVQRQGSGIGLLLNAYIYLDEGLEHLAASFNTPEARPSWRSPATTRATPASTSTTIPTGRRTYGACAPIQNCPRIHK